MQIFHDKTDPHIVRLLSSGGVVVLRTDTLYGIVARAADETAVERIYSIKDRNENKPFIILISSLDMLYDLPDIAHQQLLDSFWPGPVSVIIPSPSAPEWLRRQGSTLAYRLPASESLRHLIDEVGPLVAPSANPQGQSPSLSVMQAVDYFGDQVDAYVDGGEVDPATPPSRLYAIDDDGNMERLR